jgi:uncharacterized protein GlcG (DUF336 family)
VCVGGDRRVDELLVGGVGASGADVVRDGAVQRQGLLEHDGDGGA